MIMTVLNLWSIRKWIQRVRTNDLTPMIFRKLMSLVSLGVTSNMKSISIILLLSCLFITGCGFSHDEKITGVYRLIAVDINEQMSICYELENGSCIGRINQTVFSYGFNKRFIVAKQHPANDKSVTNYYYLDMTKDSEFAEPSESVTGPLSKEEFEKATKKLDLPKFTKTIKNLK